MSAIRLDPAEVRRALRDAGLRADRRLSQNFLADVEVLEAILAEADPSPGRQVFEIGPGLGVLTGGLLAAGARVTAVELDAGLAATLRRRFEAAIARAAADPEADGGLVLVEGDVLDQDLGTMVVPPYDVVANLPYHITSPILHRLLGAAARPERLVLMLQREVAERVAAPPGAMSYLSVFVQYHAEVHIAFTVGRGSFEPAPDVDSAVVVLRPRRPATSEPAPMARRAIAERAEREDRLWQLVQAGFRERRKMLKNVLVRQLPAGADAVDAALRDAGIDPRRRPQTLSVDEWLRLRDVLLPAP